MQIDVGAYIAELLYEHESVTVPGLGGFVSSYKPAAIDQVQGKLHPPSKDLNFNDNLVVNDGILVNFIKNKHDLSYAEALKTVEEYVDRVKTAIGKREIVVFPNVGRLYQDFENNLQFLPDNTNFNTEVYGLPSVQFFPVIRDASTATAAPKTTKKSTRSQKTAVNSSFLSGQISTWFQNNLPVIGLLSVLLIGLGTYFTFFAEGLENRSNMRKIPAYRYNVSPGGEDNEALVNADIEDEEVVALSPDDTEEPGDAEEFEVKGGDPTAEDTERPGSPSAVNEAVIIIGAFGSKGNVDRLIEKIYDEGFEPFTETNGRLTRVGIQMSYDEISEVQKALKVIRKKFDSSAQIVKPDLGD